MQQKVHPGETTEAATSDAATPTATTPPTTPYKRRFSQRRGSVELDLDEFKSSSTAKAELDTFLIPEKMIIQVEKDYRWLFAMIAITGVNLNHVGRVNKSKTGMGLKLFRAQSLLLVFICFNYFAGVENFIAGNSFMAV